MTSPYGGYLLSLLKDGVSKPEKIIPFLKSNVEKQAIRAVVGSKSEYYRRKNQIPLQKEKMHKMLEDDNQDMVVVVLDTCRYDYFEQTYQEFLTGDLTKVWSAGNATPYWTHNMWDKKINIDYVSALPFPVKEGAYKNKPLMDFSPKDIFQETTYVDSNSDIIPTVYPEVMTNIALEHIEKSSTNKTVIHYLQPHRPYTGDTKILQWRTKTDEFLYNLDEELIDDIPVDDISDKEYLMGGDILDLIPVPSKAYERISKETYKIQSQIKNGDLTWEHLIKAYQDNLLSVLPEIERLVRELDDEKIIITADHGEHLGEYTKELGVSQHPNITHPILREVPWFEVSEVKTSQEATSPRRDSLERISADLVEVNSTVLENNIVQKQGVEDTLKQLGYV